MISHHNIALTLLLVACSAAPAPEPPVLVAEVVDLAVRLPSREMQIAHSVTWMNQWIDAQPDALRFDAAIGTAAIAKAHPTAETQALFERVLGLVDQDGGHPMRRLFEPEDRVPPELSTPWLAPAEGRVNVNRVIIEAIYCDKVGFRQQTIDYICGPMRDDGSYHTAHGLWGLVLANERGCVERSPCWQVLGDELVALAKQAEVKEVPQVDLLAEQVLMLQLSGQPSAALSAQLRVHQREDGGWGVSTDEKPYYGFHATFLAAWVLALED